MKEDIARLINDLNSLYVDEEKLMSIINDILPEAVDKYGNAIEEVVLANNDLLYEKMFPYLKGKDVNELARLLIESDVDPNYVEAFQYFLSDEFCDAIFKYSIEKNGKDAFSQLIIYTTDNIDFLLSKGFTVREIYNKISSKSNQELVDYLYFLDNSLIELMNLDSHTSVNILVSEFLKGNPLVMGALLEQNYAYDKRKFISFIETLTDMGKFNADEFFSLVELENNRYYDFISCIEDDELLEKIISVGGDKSIIFAKNPSKYIVDKISFFDFNDYKIINGAYKDSPFLLYRFLEEGKRDALFYTNPMSIDENIIKFLDDYSYDELLINYKLLDNYLVVDYFVKKNYKILKYNVSDVLTNINAFTSAVALIDSGFEFEDTNNEYIFLKSVIDKDFEEKYYTFYDVSLEVARQLIDIGFSIDNYFNNVRYVKELSMVFLELGFYEVIFLNGTDRNLLEQYGDKVSYDDYINAVGKYGSISLDIDFKLKFIRDGHYEFLDTLPEYYLTRVENLVDLGLDDLSYDEYLVSDERIRNIPSLLLKFIDKHPDRVEELIAEFSFNDEIVRFYVNTGVSYEVFKNVILKNSRSNIPSDVVLHFMKQGHIDIVDYVSDMYLDNEVFELYIEMLGDDMPSKEVLNKYTFKNKLISYYLNKKEYGIINLLSYLEAHVVTALFEMGYSFNDFVNEPILSYQIIERLITKENEKELMDILKDSFVNNKKFIEYKGVESLLIKMYRIGYDIDNIKCIIEHSHFNINDFFKLLTKDEYKIIDELDIKNVFVNKVITDAMIQVMSIDKIKESLNNTSYEMIAYIIKRMVDLGHYEFINYFVQVYDDNVIKKALLDGYFPDLSVVNDAYKRKLLNLHFTDEELDYVKSILDRCPILVMYFPSIIDDTSKFNEYIMKDARLLFFFESELVNNIDCLANLYIKDINYFEKLINSDRVNSSTIIEFYLSDEYDISLLHCKTLNNDIFSKLVLKYPQIIDLDSGYMPEEILVAAYDNGYIVNDKTPTYRMVQMILFGKFDINYVSYLNRLTESDISKLFSEISYESYLVYKDALDVVLNNIIMSSKDSVIYAIFNSIVDLKIKDDFAFKYYLSYWYLNNRMDIDNDLKDKVFNNLIKYGNGLDYIKINGNSIVQILGVDYLVDKYLSGYLFSLEMFKYMNVFDDTKKEKIKESFVKRIDSFDNNEILLVLEWFCNNGFGDLANTYAIDFFELNPKGMCRYISKPTSEFLSSIEEYLFKDPSIVYYISNIVISNKELLLKMFNRSMFDVFDKASKELKRDLDICLTMVRKSPSSINYIHLDNPCYMTSLREALSLNGRVFVEHMYYNSTIKENEELIRLAIKTFPDVLLYVDDNFVTYENIELINDFSYLSVSNIKEQHFSIYLDVMMNRDVHSTVKFRLFDYITINDRVRMFIQHPFVKDIIVEAFNDGNRFKSVVGLVREYNLFNNFPNEVQTILRDADFILSNTGKINTLDKNPVFSYDLVKYIYPLMGMEFTLDLMKYNTGADRSLITAIVNGKIDLVKYYYNLIKSNNLFDDNDKVVHYAFRKFGSIECLITDIMEQNIILNEQELDDLKNIIMKNKFNVTSYSELKNYSSYSKAYVEEQLKSDDLNAVKDYLASLFGYNNIVEMKSEFREFQFDNFVILKQVYEDIKNKYGEELYNELLITVGDVKFIKLMKSIIETDNITLLKDLISNFAKSSNYEVDFYETLSCLKSKYRRMFNYQFNSRLSNIEKIVASTEVDEELGVKIIDFDHQKFNFLAHRLYSYDSSMKGYSDQLMDDPSLWFSLEGATTLSCSSFSEKGFHFLNSYDTKGVVYLFNDLPEEFMLFMYGRDLFVEHGGFKMEPTSRQNSYTDIDGLNQNSISNRGSYNEVAGFREGMVPCAFACMGEVPNDATIRAAKYFSERLGREIPIIRFNKKVYDDLNVKRYLEIKEDLRNNLTSYNIQEFFLDGTTIDTLDIKLDYIYDVINDNYRSGNISIKDVVVLITECEKVINRGYLGNRHYDDTKRKLAKLEMFKKSLITLAELNKEDVVMLENANLGESGIMYKYTTDEGEYLLKPAVDKQKHELQSFRAEIQVAASKLQTMLNPQSAVLVNIISDKHLKLSKQELLKISDDKKAYLSNWMLNGGEIEQHYLVQLLREYVVDMLLCNFDAFAGNFIIDCNDNVRAIDKEQSFRFIDDAETLKPDFSYVPNGSARVPIYKIIFERYNAGLLDMDLSPITDVVENVKLISDEDYRELFVAYAKSLSPDNYEELLDKIVKRKHDVTTNIERYIEELTVKKGSEDFRI